MTTTLHDVITEFPPADRDAIIRTLVSDEFSSRFEILLGLEDGGPEILFNLFGFELLRMPGQRRQDDAIDTLNLGYVPDEQLTGRRETLLTLRELDVINCVLISALLTEKTLTISEGAIAALQNVAVVLENDSGGSGHVPEV